MSSRDHVLLGDDAATTAVGLAGSVGHAHEHLPRQLSAGHLAATYDPSVGVLHAAAASSCWFGRGYRFGCGYGLGGGYGIGCGYRFGCGRLGSLSLGCNDAGEEFVLPPRVSVAFDLDHRPS